VSSDDVSAVPAGDVDFLALYDEAVPQVYGYLLRRVGSASVAEDLTSETFMAGVAAVHRGTEVTVGWFITVARNKLVDHWRRRAREERGLRLAYDEGTTVVEPWDVHLDSTHAHEILGVLAPQQRLALTLRYLDGLPVVQVATALGRTLHATEALLVRSRAAFRRAYEEGADA
jgi:RNA polymerase sigma-70 factor (ECF subfamily)